MKKNIPKKRPAKKNRGKAPTSHQIRPGEALRFLEDMRTLSSQIDEQTIAISLRVPANVLRAIKSQAKIQGKKYQSLMIEFLRKGLTDETSNHYR